MLATSGISSWRFPPASLCLENDEVHVWRASLALTTPRIQSLLQTLSPEERRRAERFRFQKHLRCYIVARGLLRTILGGYLGLEPYELEFCYNSYGKPALTKTFGGETFRFNLSHSYDIALYTIANRREVGVDIERIRLDFAYEEIAEKFFSPREIAALRALSPSMRQEAFFACWTRKEAYIKARGEGLTLRLDQFDVTLAPGEPALLLGANGDQQEASRWSLRMLTPGPGYVAALAVEGHDWRLKCWQWRD